MGTERPRGAGARKCGKVERAGAGCASGQVWQGWGDAWRRRGGVGSGQESPGRGGAVNMWRREERWRREDQRPWTGGFHGEKKRIG